MPWKVVNYLSVVYDFWWGLVKSRELRRRDCTGFTNVTIFKSSPRLSAIGSGINLQPSVLRNLGLLPALEATGIKTAELRYYNRYGHYVVSEPRGESAGYLVPQISMQRNVA
jgi:hypothetical protein